MGKDYEYTINKYYVLEQLSDIFFKLRILKEEDIELEDLPDDVYLEIRNLITVLELLIKDDYKNNKNKLDIKSVRVSSLKEKLVTALQIVQDLEYPTLEPDQDLDVDDIVVLRQLRNYLDVI